MSAMRIAVVGHGQVGGALTAAFLGAGHDVVLATNPARPEGATQARDRDPRLAAAAVADPADAVRGADLVVLAVPFAAVGDVLAPLRDALTGAVVVDATNPVGPGLTHGLGSTTSGAQHVAALIPGAAVVKAFSVYGFENLHPVPEGPGPRPVMFHAGDDRTAKDRVAGLLTDLGWEPIDAGGLEAALDLEHLTLLWVRMVRLGGRDPRLVWAALRRPATG
ncbi:NADPH-dependent F420 reductase [Kineosporia sp. R_H_3]|uniref:NADPH-dependent F420 reductase n=1 Tax=Kineosporia sp. R_H_3 TaxID=1961848 RepID=UPI000B4B114F|nr:NAD(P)-binding domain-containing protein [Kineosporia sp. R_H_3]